MRTLFILELKRALKSPFFWLSLLVPLGINAEHLLFSECGFTIYATSYFFVNAPIICVILAILIPIHIGHDFETRTINNKITAGCTKKDIFLAEVGVGAVLATLLFVIVSLAVVAFSNIKHHTVDPNFTLTRLLVNAFISWLGLVTVSTFFTMLAMLTHRQLISIAMALLLTIGLLAAGGNTVSNLREEPTRLDPVTHETYDNILYIDGLKRQATNAVLLMSPFAQAEYEQYRYWEPYNKRDNSLIMKNAPFHFEFCIVNLLEILLFCGIGIRFFRKQDLK